MSEFGKSSIAAEHWLPVYEALVQGLMHALNNRVAALSGIVQLYQAQLSTGDEGMQQLTGEVEKLRQLLTTMRGGLGVRPAKREPMRLGDAFQTAASLLAYHLEARQAQYTAPQDSGDVEPVFLHSADALRFALLTYLAAARATGKGGAVTAVLARLGDDTVVTVTAPGSAAAVKSSVEFAAVAEAAAREGGVASCAEGIGESVLLMLALPGLTKATAHQEHIIATH